MAEIIQEADLISSDLAEVFQDLEDSAEARAARVAERAAKSVRKALNDRLDTLSIWSQKKSFVSEFVTTEAAPIVVDEYDKFISTEFSRLAKEIERRVGTRVASFQKNSWGIHGDVGTSSWYDALVGGAGGAAAFGVGVVGVGVAPAVLVGALVGGLLAFVSQFRTRDVLEENVMTKVQKMVREMFTGDGYTSPDGVRVESASKRLTDDCKKLRRRALGRVVNERDRRLAVIDRSRDVLEHDIETGRLRSSAVCDRESVRALLMQDDIEMKGGSNGGNHPEGKEQSGGPSRGFRSRFRSRGGGDRQDR